MPEREIRPVIVVPTRNRSDLAANALRSISAEPDARVSIWLSDNSTDAAESVRLRQFCESTGDKRIRYMRPPEPLMMSRHWAWIIEQALAAPEISHVGFLTDRMIFVRGALSALMQAAQKHPDRVIAYPNDSLDDIRVPVHLVQNDWSGRVLEIDSGNFLDHLRKVGWSGALPRILNCLVPKEQFEKIRAFYGNICEAIAPDVCFGLRTLERDNSFLFLDRPLIVDYALSRSNGHSAARGETTRDYKDFLKELDQRGLNYAAPVPGLTGPANCIYHEYTRVREFSKNTRFTPINFAEYFTLITRDLRKLEDPAERAAQAVRTEEYRNRYLASGELRYSDLLKVNIKRVIALEKISPAYLATKLIRRLSQLIPAWAPFWRGLSSRFATESLAAGKRITTWPSAAEALTFVASNPLPRSPGPAMYEYKLKARALDQGESV
jgi:hypothetical protein